jgi:hypothetical protein
MAIAGGLSVSTWAQILGQKPAALILPLAFIF